MALHCGKELWFICHARDQALCLLLHGAGGCAVVQVWLARAQSIHTTPTLVFNNTHMTGHSLLSCRPIKAEKSVIVCACAQLVAWSYPDPTQAGSGDETTEIGGCGLRAVCIKGRMAAVTIPTRFEANLALGDGSAGANLTEVLQLTSSEVPNLYSTSSSQFIYCFQVTIHVFL